METQTVLSETRDVKDEVNYRALPRGVTWRLAEVGFGHSLYYDDTPAGLCCWCRRPGADYRGASFKLCIPCAMLLGYSRPWYVPVCRRCQHPLSPSGHVGTWCSPSEKDPRLCSGCAAGWLRLPADEFCRNLVAAAADGARLVAALLVERNRDRAYVVASTEASLWGNSYLFEALRLQRLCVEHVIAQVHQVAVEIVDDFEKSVDTFAERDGWTPERGTPKAAKIEGSKKT